MKNLQEQQGQATPRPWNAARVFKNNQKDAVHIFGGTYKQNNHECVAILGDWQEGKQQANANLIIKAVNCHDELVKCLRDILNHDGGAYNLEPRQSKMIMQALSKTESEK